MLTNRSKATVRIKGGLRMKNLRSRTEKIVTHHFNWQVDVDVRVNWWLHYRMSMTKTLDIAKSVEKRIYSISELAREFGVTPRALRFYEDKGLLSPDREGLNRVYSHRDRARLKLILSGRKVGFSLNDIREILDLYDLDDNQRAQLRQAYKKHKQQVEVLKQQRLEIDDALEALNNGISWMESKLASFGPTDNEAEFARAYDAVARARLEADEH